MQADTYNKCNEKKTHKICAKTLKTQVDKSRKKKRRRQYTKRKDEKLIEQQNIH